MSNDESLVAIAVPLPGGQGGVGFDDLRFATGLGKILVPAGRTGTLALLDPDTQAVTLIPGFSARDEYGAGHYEGTTSADEGAGFLFAIDRGSLRLSVIDPVTKTIVSFAILGGSPDYVRYVEPTGELWVTEPDEDQIEVFTLSQGEPPTATHAAFIPVKGGPESLVIDQTRNRAYTNLWEGEMVVLDLAARAITLTFPNGCKGSRGIALDEARGFVFACCSEGKGVALDLSHDGKLLSSITVGAGVDIISFNPELSHLYVPGGKSATMAIADVSESGQLTLLGTVTTAKGSHCVVSDDRNNAWVCDPAHGQLLLFKDTLL